MKLKQLRPLICEPRYRITHHNLDLNEWTSVTLDYTDVGDGFSLALQLVLHWQNAKVTHIRNNTAAHILEIDCEG